MTDYTELVKALRDCASGDGERCLKCTYHKASNMPCDNALMTDAAAAIEALQAEVGKKRTADCWGCKCEKVELKRGEWIEHSTYKSVLICSHCHQGSNRFYDTFKFCPNCGAKMEV